MPFRTSTSASKVLAPSALITADCFYIQRDTTSPPEDIWKTIPRLVDGIYPVPADSGRNYKAYHVILIVDGNDTIRTIMKKARNAFRHAYGVLPPINQTVAMRRT